MEILSDIVLTILTWFPWSFFMLRNRGGGVRPDRADIDLYVSTRLPMLVMDKLEAELALDLKPPPTYKLLILMLHQTVKKGHRIIFMRDHIPTEDYS